MTIGSDHTVPEYARLDAPHYITDEFPYAEADQLRLKPDRRDWTESEFKRWEKYRVTPWKYDAIMREQGHACAKCRSDEPGGRGWHTDHDHTCCPGKTSCGLCFRGILCARCNTGLGFFRDNIHYLRMAERYLERADAHATFATNNREN